MIRYEIPQEEKTDREKLFNFRPILFFAVFFVLGLAVSCWIATYDLPVWCFGLILPCGGIAFLGTSTRRETLLRAIIVITLLFAYVLGISSFALQTQNFQNTRQYHGEYAVEGRVTKVVQTPSLSWLEIEDIRIDGTKEKGALIAYLPHDYSMEVRLANRVRLLGTVDTDITLFDENGFRAYAVERDVRYVMRAERGVVTEKPFHLFLSLKQRIFDCVRSGMDETPAEVMLALLLGETSGIDAELLENVRYGGIAHVFAVSGLHVGALYVCLAFFVERFYRIPKPIRFCMMASALLFYGGICGFTPSVVRATVTCLCYYGAKLLGVAADTLETVSVACILTTLLSPCSVFTAGYQLSFGACYGIIFLSRRLEKGIWTIWSQCRKMIGKPVRTYLPHEQTHPPTILQSIERGSISFLAVTFSAQLFTAPIQLLSFGYLSVWSLLLNCIFVPIIGMVFPVCLLLTIFASVLPMAISGVLLWLPNVTVTLLTFVFHVVDFTTFAITGISLPTTAIVCYYLALLFCTDKWNVPRKYTYLCALAMFVCFLGSVWIASV